MRLCRRNVDPSPSSAQLGHCGPPRPPDPRGRCITSARPGQDDRSGWRAIPSRRALGSGRGPDGAMSDGGQALALAGDATRGRAVSAVDRADDLGRREAGGSSRLDLPAETGRGGDWCPGCGRPAPAQSHCRPRRPAGGPAAHQGRGPPAERPAISRYGPRTPRTALRVAHHQTGQREPPLLVLLDRVAALLPQPALGDGPDLPPA